METTMNKQSRMAMSDKTKQVLVDIICYLVVLLFLYAAVNKLIDYQKFQVQIGQSPILTNYANQIAWFIPTIEILIALLLIFPRTLLIGLYMSFGLMLAFTVYIIIILTFTERVPCSCGGILEKLGWTEHLVFNIFFVILTIAGIIMQSQIKEKKA